MRSSEDDVTVTSRTGHLVVVFSVVMIFIEILSSANGKVTSSLNKTKTNYHLRVIYVCDQTSEAVCTAKKTIAGMHQFSSISPESNKEHPFGCQYQDSPCGPSSNSTNKTDTSSFEYHLDQNHMILTQAASNLKSGRFNLTYHIIHGNVPNRIDQVDKLVISNSADVIVAIGDAKTVQTAAIVAEGHHIPVLGYNTEHSDGPKSVQGATYLPMNPGAEAQGKALTRIIGEFNMKQTTVIIENSQYADTFLNGVRQAVQVRKQDIFNVLALDSNIGTNVLRQKLTDLSTKGWKVIVLHCSPELMLRVVTVAMSTRLYNSGYAWFLSEMAFSRDADIIAQLPEGLLAIDSFWLGGVEDVVATALDYVMSATICVLKEELTNDQQVPYSEGQRPAIPDDGDTDPPPVIHLGNTTDFPYYFRRCLRNLINFCDNTTNASSNDTDAGDEAAVDDCIPRDNFDVFLDTSARNKGPAYYLLNTVDDGLGDRIWTKVGYITASGKRDLKTVLWPGHNIYGPSSDMVKTYRVVTRSAEPFVLINSQASRKEECHAQVPCLQVANSSQSLLTIVVDDFQSEMRYLDDLYTVHCCKGLVLEMLETLAEDLNFR